MPAWRIECATLNDTHQAFEVWDVRTDEQKEFLQSFALAHNLGLSFEGDTAYFKLLSTDPANPFLA